MSIENGTLPTDTSDNAPQRLTDAEVDALMRHYPATPETDLDRVRAFLGSELGLRLVKAEEKLHATKAELREQIAAIKQDMLGATSRIDFVYVLIGEFVVKFSQIEFWLRMAFSVATRLETEAAIPILAKLDFQSLVAITSTLFAERYVSHPAMRKHVQGIFSRCLELNDARVRIVHGSWFVNEARIAAEHLSRQTMRYQSHFPSRDELKKQIANLDLLDNELRKLLEGDYDPPDEDD